jgi:transcriptional regulator GlxA family with amidase domain
MAAKNFVTAFGSLAGGCQAANAAGLDQILAAMLRDARSGAAFVRAVADHYLAILLLLVHRSLATQRTHPSHAQTTFLEAKSLMDQHYMKLFTVAEFARECGISYEHMSRLFRRYEGMPPSVYLQRLRMAQAAQHLAETDDAVAVIARRAGYADPFAFSKAFKRCLMLAPRDYRRRFRR